MVGGGVLVRAGSRAGGWSRLGEEGWSDREQGGRKNKSLPPSLTLFNSSLPPTHTLAQRQNAEVTQIKAGERLSLHLRAQLQGEQEGGKGQSRAAPPTGLLPANRWRRTGGPVGQ